MNLCLFFAAQESQTVFLLAAVGMMFLVLVLFMVIWASRYRKVGPDEVLVVSGRRVVVHDQDGKEHVCGFRMVKGGGTFVFPVVEQVSVLSVKPFSLELTLPRVVPRGGGSVRLALRAQVRIKPDDVSLAAAAESLLGKTPQELKDIGGQILESSSREVIGTHSEEEILQNQSGLSTLVQVSAEPKLATLGLGLLSLSVRDLGVSGKGASVQA